MANYSIDDEARTNERIEDGEHAATIEVKPE